MIIFTNVEFIIASNQFLLSNYIHQIHYFQPNLFTNQIDQKMAQSNNIGSSSHSYEREMQVQCERTVLKTSTPQLIYV